MRLTTLTTLVVLFIAAVTLGTTIPRIWVIARNESRAARDAMADSVAAELSRAGIDNHAAVDEAVRRLTRVYPILTVSVDSPPQPDSINTRMRRVGAHTITIQFTADGRLSGATR